jgi:outer membrane protein TolC
MKVKYLVILAVSIFNACASFAQVKNLDYFLSRATANSPSLNDLRNQVASARIDSQVLLASTKLLVTAGGNSFFAPTSSGFGYDPAITNGGQLQALLTVAKNLVPKSTLKLEYQAIKYQIDSLNAASKITEQDLKKAIISQYITTYGDQLQLEFGNSLQSMLEREEVILKKLTRDNVYRQVDYLSFLITYEQQQLSRLQLKNQYKNDYATLNYLAGIFDTTTSPLELPSFTLNNDINFDSSVFMVKYKIDSMRLFNTVSLINAGYRPRISLYADGGYQSAFSSQGYKNFGSSVGINFTVPVYDGHQRRLQLSKVSIAEQARKKNRDFFTTQYRQQIAQLRQQIMLLDELLPAINNQIKYTETLLEADLKLLQTGDIKMSDIVLTINNYITARNLNVQNTISRMQLINQINYWNRQ